MLHKISTTEAGAQGQVMADAVSACVHCGFCLPACPTYVALGEEMDSPRGRIVLMKSVLEGELSPDQAAPHIDRCLGCLSCQPACPSGVPYGNLLTSFRGWSEAKRSRAIVSRLQRWLVLTTLPYPNRARLVLRAARFFQMFRRWLPAQLRAAAELAPSRVTRGRPLPELTPAQGKRRARVALVSGCVQQVVAPEINWATLRVLAANGVDVVVPPKQSCCGALSAHTGALAQAKLLARCAIQAMPYDVDAYITNAAGCGSGIHEYPVWFAGDEFAEEARQFANRAVDVSVFLADLGLRQPGPLSKPMSIVYHDACHLAHSQQVVAEPRKLLKQIPNLDLQELPHTFCCGSAGTYNLEQPELASQLGREKAKAMMELPVEAACTGNIGCLVQISAHLHRLGCDIPVLHTMQVLDQAYGKADP